MDRQGTSRKELADLESAEARLSAERRRLHHQIDFGYATDATLRREREVSDQRRQLHHRIDELRERLDVDGAASSLSVADQFALARRREL